MYIIINIKIQHGVVRLGRHKLREVKEIKTNETIQKQEHKKETNKRAFISFVPVPRLTIKLNFHRR